MAPPEFISLGLSGRINENSRMQYVEIFLPVPEPVYGDSDRAGGPRKFGIDAATSSGVCAARA